MQSCTFSDSVGNTGIGLWGMIEIHYYFTKTSSSQLLCVEYFSTIDVCSFFPLKSYGHLN